jgi:hypothetical protein
VTRANQPQARRVAHDRNIAAELRRVRPPPRRPLDFEGGRLPRLARSDTVRFPLDRAMYSWRAGRC